jgi:hypothetical protein
MAADDCAVICADADTVQVRAGLRQLG